MRFSVLHFASLGLILQFLHIDFNLALRFLLINIPDSVVIGRRIVITRRSVLCKNTCFFIMSLSTPIPPPPALGMFHGGYIPDVGYTNTLTRFTSDGVMVGSEVSRPVSYHVGQHSGARSDVNALFRGGHNSVFNKSFQVNSGGLVVNDQSNIGTYRNSKPGGGNVGVIAMFYGGGGDLYNRRLITRINPNNTLLEEKVSGSSSDYAKTYPAMASLTDSMIAYSSGGGLSNQVRTALLFNADGIIIDYRLNVGSSDWQHRAGAAIGDVGIFYAGAVSDQRTNVCVRLNKTLTQVGNDTYIGRQRTYTDGANVDDLAMFYGGYVVSSTRVSNLTRINVEGSMVGIESNAGSGRYHLAGTGI